MWHVMTAVNGVKEEMLKVICHHLLNARRRRAAPTGNSVGNAATHNKEDRKTGLSNARLLKYVFIDCGPW
jgi:hypothetical protein